MKSFMRGFQFIFVVTMIMAFVIPSVAEENELVRQMELNRIKKEIKGLPPQAKVETNCPDKCGKITADIENVQKRERQVVEAEDKIVNNISESEVEWNKLKDIKESKGLSNEEQSKLADVDYRLKSLYKQIAVLEKELLDLDSKATELKDQLAACERQCLCEKGKGFADLASCERACPRELGKYCFFQIPLTEGGTGCWNCIPEGYRGTQLMYCEKYGPAGYTDFDTCKLKCPKMTSYCRGESLKILAGDKIGDVKRKEDVEKTRCFKCVPRTVATGGTPGPGAVKVEEGGPEVKETPATTPTALASETQITLGGELRTRGQWQAGVDIGAVYNEVTQYHHNGQRSNKDQGWAYRIGLDLGKYFWDDRFLVSFDGKVTLSRDLNHSLYMPSGVMDNINTKILGFEGEFLGQYNFFPHNKFNIAPLFGLDYWNFERHVYTQSDFEERWQLWDLIFGAEVEDDLSWPGQPYYLPTGLFAKGGVRFPFWNTVKVDSQEVPGGVRFDPGKRPGYFAEIGIQWRRFTLSLNWTQDNFAESSPVFIESLGGSFTENKTKINRYAVGIKYSF